MADRSIVVRLRAEIGGYQTAMLRAAAATNNLEAANRRASTGLGRMLESANANRQSWETAGRSLAMFGAVAVGGIGLAVKAAVDWESAWTGVLKTVDGTPAQLKAVEDGLRAMARELPISHKELAATAEAAGQLGIKTKDILGFTRVMADLGNTTNLTADEAATSIAQLMNVMQTAPEDVDNLGAALVDLGNNGASTERDIVQMAQRISGAGAIVGASEADILGIANAVASVGIEVEAGGSAISRILTDMAKAVKQGGVDLDGFAQVAGMSSEAFVKAFESDPANAFASFTEGLGRIDAAGGDVFTTLGLLGQSDIRVSRALLSMAKSGTMLRESIELSSEAWASNTALLEEAEKRYGTTASKIESAKGSIADAAITMGSTFLPVVAEMADGIGGLANSFGSLPGFMQAGIGVTTALIGVSALLGGAFLLLTPRIVAAHAAMLLIARDAPRAAAAMRVLGGVMLGAVQWAAAFVALSAAVGTFTDKVLISGKVVPQMDAIKESVRGVAESGDGIEHLNGLFRNFGDVGGLAVNDAKSLADAFDQLLTPSTTDRVSGFFGSLPGVTSYVEQAEERVTGLDNALKSMLDEGEADAVIALQDGLVDMGYSAEEINKLLPKTSDAMLAISQAAPEAEAGVTGVGDAMVLSADEAEAAAEALEEWIKKVTEASMTFIDPVGAYDAVIAANTAFAQSTADATEDAEDSWEDYYDGHSVSMADYLAGLQAQIDAQMSYNSNLLALQTKVSNEYFAYLEGLGAAGAPLIAALANATAEELDQADALYVTGQENAAALVAGMEANKEDYIIMVDASGAEQKVFDFAANMDETGDTRPAWIIAAEADAARREAAGAATDLDATGVALDPWKLFTDPAPAVGGATNTGGFINRVGGNLTAWALRSNTTPAITSANAAVTDINAKSASIKVTADTSAASGIVSSFRSSIARLVSIPVGASVGAGAGHATGGPIVGPGTGTSDSIPAMLSNGEHVITAAEVAAAGGHAAVYEIRAEMRKGRKRYADGGEVATSPRAAWSNINPQSARSYAPTVQVAAPSLEGMVLTGTLMVNGMEAQMHAVASSAIESRQRDMSGRRGRA